MIDALGYAASIAVLATFLMPTMLPLRLVAILSNILFLLYGYFAHIPPVLFLHATLLRKSRAVSRFATAIASRCGFIKSDDIIGADQRERLDTTL